MTYRWRSRAGRFLVAIVVGGVIAGCLTEPWVARAASDESTRYYERAQGYLAKGDLQAAIIELKNSVRADPANAAALYSLGVAFLRSGDAASAESQLKAARDHGAHQKRSHRAVGDSPVDQLCPA